MKTSSSLQLDLQAGESAAFYFSPGCRLVLLEGKASLIGSPLWLAERCHTPRQSLPNNIELGIDEAGWLRISAESRAKLILTQPQRRRLPELLRAMPGKLPIPRLADLLPWLSGKSID